MPFKPGQTGNPRGRAAEDRKVKLLARQHTDKAIAKLAEWMNSDNPKASVSAACALLDRAYGKPKQTIDAQIVKRIVDESRVGTIRDKLRASQERTVQ
jgi:uncharacterized membrane protein